MKNSESSRKRRRKLSPEAAESICSAAGRKKKTSAFSVSAGRMCGYETHPFSGKTKPENRQHPALEDRNLLRTNLVILFLDRTPKLC